MRTGATTDDDCDYDCDDDRDAIDVRTGTC